MESFTCRLCNSDRLTRMFEVAGSSLYRCGSCRFVQVREQPTAEELQKIYGDAFFSRGKYENDPAQLRENQRRLSLLEATGLPAHARVLDVGCATGDFLACARDRFDMWGLDVSPYATEVARKKNPAIAEHIFTGFIEDQRFEEGSFDAIVMWDVIEHVWDPAAVCRQLIKYLRPGGSFLLSTPDIGALTARIMGARWAFMTPPEHLGFFSKASLGFLLEGQLGLTTTSSEAIGKWGNVGFLAYKLRRVFPIVPQLLVTQIQKSPIGRATMYVPTEDVRYVSARKPEA